MEIKSEVRTTEREGGEGGMENTGTKEKNPVRREDVQTKLIMKCVQDISAARGFSLAIIV